MILGFINYRFKDSIPAGHTKPYFSKFNILTIHGVIAKIESIL